MAKERASGLRIRVRESLEELPEPLSEDEVGRSGGRFVGPRFGEEGAGVERRGGSVGEQITRVDDAARGTAQQPGGDRPQPVESGGHVATEAGAEHDPRVDGHRRDARLGVAGGLFEGQGHEGELGPAVGGERVGAWRIGQLVDP